jgi:hypothetical protein
VLLLQKMKSNRQWCYDHFINVRNMKTVQDIRDQVWQVFQETTIVVNRSVYSSKTSASGLMYLPPPAMMTQQSIASKPPNHTSTSGLYTHLHRPQHPPVPIQPVSTPADRCLLAGFFANVAVLQPNQSYKVLIELTAVIFSSPLNV